MTPSTTADAQPQARKVKWTPIVGETLTWVFLFLSAILMLVPLLWMFVNAFKEQWEIVNVPMIWFPAFWRYDNFLYVLERSPIATGYKNSLIIVPIVTAIQVFTSIIAGYAFAKLRFPGRELLFV